MKRQTFANNILVFLLIACSGIPFFVGSNYLMPLAFLYALILCLIRGKNILDPKFVLVLFFLILIVFLREITNGFEPSMFAIAVIILKYSFSFLVLKLTRLRFLTYYNTIIYYLSIVSLFFFTVFTVFPDLESYFKLSIAPFFEMKSRSGFYEYAPNFILYTMNEHGRNHGPFWEAGGFGAFLIIALIFHIIQKRSIFNKQGIVFLVSAATTFSTATYAALFFIVISYSFYISDYRYRILLLAVIIIGSINAYSGFEFLQKKVEKSYETVSGEYESRVANRFTSVLIDLDKIVKHPILGNPQNTKEKYTIYSHRNNGLSSMAVEYGLIYTILFFTFIYLSFKRLSMVFNNYRALTTSLFILAIMSIYFSQVLTNKPLFNLLAFWPFILKNLQVKIKKNKSKAVPIRTKAPYHSILTNN